MLMYEATPEMVEEWKQIWTEFKYRLRPNRKSGLDVVSYLKNRYPVKELHDDRSKQIVIKNVLANKPYAEKIPNGKTPLAISFIMQNMGEGKKLYDAQDDVYRSCEIFVGIELASGCFFVEGSSHLWDELLAFQGLDAIDIENFYLVSEYISCLKRFGLLESALRLID